VSENKNPIKKHKNVIVAQKFGCYHVQRISRDCLVCLLIYIYVCDYKLQRGRWRIMAPANEWNRI